MSNELKGFMSQERHFLMILLEKGENRIVSLHKQIAERKATNEMIRNQVEELDRILAKETEGK
jgi:hypothetical protein